MDEIFLLYSAMSFFIGFVLGRIGHMFGGQIKSPHHWIYGFILIVASSFLKENLSFLVLLFGLGVFISDFKDFLNLKFYGVDDIEVKKFWRVD